MNKINCSVNNCSHNKDLTCYSNRVNIGGKTADNKSSTCCGSFLDKITYSDLTNNASSPIGCDCLVCNVDSCSHNNNNLCDLDSINVTGEKVKIYSETNCSSFSLK